jgi:glycerol-3-phosphate cytidylyltransferase-like family protein
VDTRSKILTVGEAVALMPARPLILVTGYFDLLRAEHVQELERVRGRSATVAAVVMPRTPEFLSQHARAELVAALRMIDYVFIANPEDLEALSAALNPAEIVRLEEADLERARQLIEHVHHRQTC